MTAISNRIFLRVFYYCALFLMVFFPHRIISEEIEWLEVSKTNNELLSIVPESIKYNNKGYLTVIAKHSEIVSEKQTISNNDTFLLAIDCDNRLFTKLSANADLNRVRNWENPVNNKLIKKTIINCCSY